MSVCAPPRIDVNSTLPPSGVNDGWLSYPGLLVMLTGRAIVATLPAVVSVATKISVSGGEGGVCACANVRSARPGSRSSDRTAPRIVGQHAVPRHPEHVTHHELLERRSHQHADADEER